ncbi:flagellar basal-body MS-ring/collar protein FliF [Dyella sp. A6]|uniref:flagellar basal-body MS-ring/collar protein FliF n=1 Tax=Dyella aluminiiresistens TaxID=3069105 RepID=UPI002E7A7028|nr:flagellar basal-body MS-ring/collar protein FliF [Dyella sp. A6]
MADNAIAPSPEGSRLDSLKQVMSHAAARQLLLLVGVAAAVAFGVAVVLWSRGPNYTLLYAGLEQKDAAAITQALQAAGTPYKLGPDGASIMVPASKLAATRLKLAAQGLPQGVASTGVEQQASSGSPFGMSDLAERTHYQQMLEMDLGNTIASLQSVRSARVHLAMPQPSAFLRDNHPASASVLVTLYPGRQLDSSQVAAIVHLVSSSVPGLDPGNVSVVDQQGQLLTTSDPGSVGALGDVRLRLATRMENSYAQRIEDLLTPLVGPGRVHAQVSVDLNFSQSEKASETYDPNHPALRSEQTSSDQRSAGGSSGVPGALSNQPPNVVAQPTAANPGKGAAVATASSSKTSATAAPVDISKSATRNYELDRTISHVSNPAGGITRLTVAVLVDNKLVAGPKGTTKSVPFTAQELQRLTELTKNAVGFDAARGDSVTVINQSFSQVPGQQSLPTQSFWQRPGMLDLIKQGVGLLVALIVAFGLLRPLLRGVFKGPATAQPAELPAPVPTVSVRVDDDADEEQGVRLAGPSHEAYEQRIQLARRMVNDDPRQVAQVVKNWVGEDGS